CLRPPHTAPRCAGTRRRRRPSPSRCRTSSCRGRAPRCGGRSGRARGSACRPPLSLWFEIIQMRMIEFVHDAMPTAQPLRVEVVSGAGFELLIGLSSLTRRGTAAPAPAGLRRALERVGVNSAELWLHLLGVALEHPDDVVAGVRALDGVELRRHLVGVHVPAWQTVVGREALEATAAGDSRLLDHDRYYSGEARDSLELLLPLSPAQTKRRVLEVLTRYESVVSDPVSVAELERDAEAK